VASWADFLRQRDCRRPATATHIDDPLASFGPGSVNQYVRDRREQNVLMLLAIGPVLAPRPIPVCDLVGIQIVACRSFHVCSPPRHFSRLFLGTRFS
jgi:hypothetical protein